MHEPFLVEKGVEGGTGGPDVAEVGIAAGGASRKHDGGAGLDGEEEEVEDVTAHVADAAVGVVEGEDEVGVPFSAIAVCGNRRWIEWRDELRIQPLADKVCG